MSDWAEQVCVAREAQEEADHATFRELQDEIERLREEE